MSENICSVCGKPYSYQCRVRIMPNGEKACYHDGEFRQDIYLDGYEKKIKKGLKPNEKLVKGRDGISRICEYEKSN